MISEGEKEEEIKPGFLSILTPAEEGKLLAFRNTTKDTQFNIAMQFQEGKLTMLGETRLEGDKYAVEVYPGETKELVKGKWKAMKRTLCFGPPDGTWHAKLAAALNGKIDAEILQVKKVLKQNPKQDGKYTAEYIASVCEKEKVPFIDLTFVPRQGSIGRDFEGPMDSFPWIRPASYCQEARTDPCLYVGDIEPNDIDQGALGDCYFLCALACVSEFPSLVEAMFSPQQCPSLGIYRAVLCKNGWWQVVTVDDTLPYSTRTKLPAFAKNREEPNELWVSLLEKAYAKVHGSYAAIKAGDPALAITDLVGGPYEKFKDRPEWGKDGEMFQFLERCDREDQLMSLGTPGVDTTSYGGEQHTYSKEVEEMAAKYEAVGLCAGHAFSLIAVKETSQGHKLCQIRNPWGNELEWNGEWSDNSSLWTADLKKEVGFCAADDGTFWMAWEDVMKWFEGGSVTYPLTDWTQVRVAANFDQGIPDLVLQVFVTAKTKCWFGAHQRDGRGLPPGDKDRNYIGLMLGVVQQKEDKDAVKKVAASGGGSFQMCRDVFAQVTLEPNTKKTPYYVLVQGYQDMDKSFTVSGFFSETSAVKVNYLSYKEALKHKYNPVSRFVPSTCCQKVAAKYQLLVPQEHLPREGQGDFVNFSLPPIVEEPEAPKPAGKKARAKAGGKKVPVAAKKSENGRSPRTKDALPADGVDSASQLEGSGPKKAPAPAPMKRKDEGSAPVMNAKATEESGTNRNEGTAQKKLEGSPKKNVRWQEEPGTASQKPDSPLSVSPLRGSDGQELRRTLRITVVQGRDLVAKTKNKSLSNPFVTLRLLDKDGKRYEKPQKQSTKPRNRTVNPSWGESFAFDVLSSDTLSVECFHKVTFGKKPMGSHPLKVDALGIKPGGPGTQQFYPLTGDDATGDIELALSY